MDPRQAPPESLSTADLGQTISADFSRRETMAFSPELHEADFDLKVDDIVFVK